MDETGASNRRETSFGEWRFNADTGDLCRADTTTRLEPQVGKLLAYFLTHQNQLITRDELIRSVWGNRTVSDDAIQRCVSILRQNLTPEDKNAYIETVVRKGYLAHFPDTPVAEPVHGRGRPIWRTSFRRRILGSSVLVLVLVLVGLVMARWLGGSSTLSGPAQPPMVAVLLFNTASGDDESRFFANGVHDDLLTQLAKLESLRVVSRTSVLAYEGKRQNIRKIGQELGADAILEGGIQISGDRIRINAQLIDAGTDEHLWAETYDRELTPANLFDVQAEIARSISSALNTTLSLRDEGHLALVPTQNMAAWRAYHEAMLMRDRLGGGAIQRPEYREALQRAVALDPHFSRAWGQFGFTVGLFEP